MGASSRRDLLCDTRTSSATFHTPEVTKQSWKLKWPGKRREGKRASEPQSLRAFPAADPDTEGDLKSYARPRGQLERPPCTRCPKSAAH
ncbi:hypothetical protein EYF80_031504 [Liparis tanakae]|uniref:Uncharacterized protein n=1 Tax=Liparis tanakae TaxID=230148 RepID=A0A4Z2H098_9TELE|nr:hypothetical protein EYF80_031504 [Liparis tanakae]